MNLIKNGKVGLLGGSFNPAHEGHLHISRKAIDIFDLDQVWWMVSPQNPLKDPAQNKPIDERFESAERIASSEDVIIVTKIEQELKTQYSFDTITALKESYPDNDFLWLMGADNLENFDKWKNWEEIFSAIPIAILDREPYQESALSSLAAKQYSQNRIQEDNADTIFAHNTPAWVYLHIPTHPESSTRLRENS